VTRHGPPHAGQHNQAAVQEQRVGRPRAGEDVVEQPGKPSLGVCQPPQRRLLEPKEIMSLRSPKLTNRAG
jgi:hypothetical protein